MSPFDTKKKELIGQFRNPGCVWSKEPTLVNDHDFRSDALGIAAPYDLYDTLASRGSLYVGTSHDTPEFAADNVARWWCDEGEARYPEATELLLLADGGGSNGYRNRAFKYWLQNRLCDPHSLVVTVCHYPTGASKWNPVDHRLFSEITKNWAGRPSTASRPSSPTRPRPGRTATGLTVQTQLIEQPYEKGLRITQTQMNELDIEPHATQPNRNYTIYPRV